MSDTVATSLVYFLCFLVTIYPTYVIFKKIRNLKIAAIAGVILIAFAMSIDGGVLIVCTISLMHMVYSVYRNFGGVFAKQAKPKYINPSDRSTEKLYLESNLGTIEIGNPFRSILVSGGAGAGKSKSAFYPFIRQFAQNSYSGVLYDQKAPELIEFAYSEHKKQSNPKVQFKVLDFKNPEKSNKCNPLSPRYVNKQAVAFEMATVLINNLMPETIKKRDFFSRSTISILAGCIWFLAKNFPNQSTLPHLIVFVLDHSSEKLIELVCKDKECAGMMSSVKEALDQGASKQLAGVVGTLKMSLGQLNIPEVFELMSEDEINLDINNPEAPTFLCIGNDSTLSATFGPVISLVISCCLRMMNQPNKHRSVVSLDELPTIYIPGLEQLPATARSNKIITLLGFQDLSQLIDSYGNDKAQVLLSNAGNQLFGRTTNEKTADMIVRLAGKHDVEYTSRSKGTSYGNQVSNSEGTNTGIQQRERITPLDIQQLKPGQFVGMVADNKILPYFKIVRFEPLEDIEYSKLLNIARVDNKTLDQIYTEVQNLDSEKATPQKLLDFEIDDSEIILDDDEINPNKDDKNDDDDLEDSDDSVFTF